MELPIPEYYRTSYLCLKQLLIMVDNKKDYKECRRRVLRERSRHIRDVLGIPYEPGSTLRFRKILEFPDGSINYVYFYEPAELKGARYGYPHYILVDANSDQVRWADNSETFMIMSRELPEVEPCL